MENFANKVSTTMRLSNKYLLMMMENSGLYGLAPSHGDILSILFEEQEEVMSELAKRISRDPSTVTALVKKLVSLGFASTKKSEDDKRQTIVFLTSKGKQLRSDFDEISQRLNSAWQDEIEPSELEIAYKVMEKIGENLLFAIAKETLEIAKETTDLYALDKILKREGIA